MDRMEGHVRAIPFARSLSSRKAATANGSTFPSEKRRASTSSARTGVSGWIKRTLL